MIHIWSSTLRRRVVGSVEFVCPRCGLDRSGYEMIIRSWWGLGRLPVIPIGDEERAVSCAVCRHQFDIGVLEIPTTAQLAVLLERASVSAVAIVVRASTAGEAAGVIERSIAMLAADGYAYDGARLAAEIDAGTRHRDHRHIRKLRDELTRHGKLGFLHRMRTLVTTDGPLCPAHQEALIAVGGALGVAASHVRGLIAMNGDRVDV